MISNSQIKEIMTKEHINCFEVMVEKNFFEKSLICLESNDINELISFMKSNNIKNAFYDYTFYNKDYFLINEQLTSEFGEDAYSLIVEEAEAHNEMIETFDFSRPLKIKIFCIYESHYIAIIEYDSWCEDLGILSAEEKILDLLECKKEKLESNKKKRKLNDEKLKAEFKNYILHDEEFTKCTNQRLRRDYMYLVFDKEDAQKYKSLFFNEYGRLDISIAVNFIEILWREYKLKK